MSVTASRRRRIGGLLALALAAALLFTAITLSQDDGDRPDSSAKDSASSAGHPSAGASTPPAESPEQRQQYAELAKLARRSPHDPMARGRADAPVVLVEYSDFQCPFCRQFARHSEPKLVQKYVDRGVLRIEWRNFPIFGDESQNAARAAWAAGRQGRFWQYHDALYAHAPKKKNTGAFTAGRLAALARQAGIRDLARFRTDMASPGASKSLGADTDEGYALGVSSTPAFLVNGRPILGAQPLSVFEQAIDRARAEAAPAGGTGARR